MVLVDYMENSLETIPCNTNFCICGMWKDTLNPNRPTL